ncbi:carbohydrate ABC transporter permease [Rhizobium hainanense]|uniref:Carbohydrate ABC transporter membrane protein 1, CUT1 family n=1 Tax=Rhizobium hainanense TaxID=52131 RepID=A0A1C3W8S4_9HYPH|nr:sugar ABC transporter permease [Rhizobium hainanense]SCB36567.1 carbohydrate ABC transporter membrane protein 1, CUT1 family [Rhizobium hainanense]
MNRQFQKALFLAPAVIMLTVFFLFPLFEAVRLSFTDSSGLGDYSYVGFSNYVRVFTRSKYYDSFTITIEFVALVVVLQTALGLAFATVLNAMPTIRNFCRAALFMPAMMSFIIVGYIWSFILSPFSGGLNAFLDSAGLGMLKHEWLGDPVTALLFVAVAHVWMFTGYTCAIFLAGFANIPSDLEEAAKLDGANAWQRFCRIQLPLLAPSFTVNIMLSTIGTMKTFELPFVMTKGGPDGATQTIGLQIIQTLFQEYRFGLASALSVVLLVLVLIVAFVQNRLLRRREEML